MNKAQLIAKLADKHDMPLNQANRILDYVLDTITDTLRSGEQVRLMGFGTFECRTYPARVGRVPRTGETVDIPAKTRVKFKQSKVLLT